ncbi:hypothetical protein niasHT_011557 [Heterodera trifolii]|uniref:Secreted protein n=1 Tax=Heterodera trifolii TaxID=157864 RepID=A0ABD2L7K6_9BILA
MSSFWFFAPFLFVLFLLGFNELFLLVNSSRYIGPPAEAGQSCGCASEQPGTLLLVCIIKCRDELMRMERAAKIENES